jgi:ribosomal protein S18 acetylase RimI-like enzyme
VRIEAGPTAGRLLVATAPEDTFAQVCGLGGLVREAVLGDRAALWRGHPWGSGWIGGGDGEELARLVREVAPEELTAPASLGLPAGYRRGWGWGWHALRTPPSVQTGEDRVGELGEDDPQLVELVARAFPDAETPPGDERVARWFGARLDGQLVACAAELKMAPRAALLSSLTVDPAVRRAGWGAAVTAWFARQRFERGADVVALGTYLTNEPARALYGRLGFADVPYLGAARADLPVTPAAH